MVYKKITRPFPAHARAPTPTKALLYLGYSLPIILLLPRGLGIFMTTVITKAALMVPQLHAQNRSTHTSTFALARASEQHTRINSHTCL